MIRATLVALAGLLIAGLGQAQDLPGEDAPLALDQRFAPAHYGYSIRYPGLWQPVEPVRFSVVFGGPPGTPAFHTTVAIQNVRVARSDDMAAEAAQELAAYEGRMRDDTVELTIQTRKPFIKRQGEAKPIIGYQMVADFVRKGEGFRQWVVILPRAKAPILHVWSYTAPVEQFAGTLPTARAMLDSWTLDADSSD
ncbi:MAG: hypothetical protein HZC25_03600 [Rhodospirillales bacterium]|nr:hypothetical protein [Rhodospirillales bacterium]